MCSHELGQIADRLHGNRLMEQLERLLAVDAEAAAEGRAVRREAVMHLGSLEPAQTLSQVADIRAEAAEVLGDGQRRVHHNVKALRRSLRILEPEHLRKSDELAEAVIDEASEDDRVAMAVPQRSRRSGSSSLTGSSANTASSSEDNSSCRVGDIRKSQKARKLLP
jgi:hypothetical protein